MHYDRKKGTEIMLWILCTLAGIWYVLTALCVLCTHTGVSNLSMANITSLSLQHFCFETLPSFTVIVLMCHDNYR